MMRWLSLQRAFNKMAGSMQSLIDKVKEDERKMRKADLRLLQEQIQPHFFFIIRWTPLCG